MTVRIAVVDPLPMFRHGMAVVLADAGYPVQLPDDLLAWLRGGDDAIVVLTLWSERDWILLRQMGAEPTLPRVIVLLDDESVATGVRAVRAGARSVLPRAVAARALRRTVEATVSGQAVMPADVAVALAANAPAPAGEVPDVDIAALKLSDDQLSWLRQLANGATVAQVADQAGYSERAMFRLLRAVYEQLGVDTRIQAIMRLQVAGWL